MATNSNGLEIPVSTPGAEKAAGDLDKVASSLGKLGGTATETGAKVASGSNSSAESLKKIGDAAKKSEQHIADMKVTGNAALQELGQKGAEFAKSMGGAAGAVAELGVKVLASAGPYGAMAAAGIGAVGMLVNAMNEHQAALERDQAVTESLAASTATLGGTYPSVVAAVNAATTAQGAHTAAARANMEILQQQIALTAQGMSGAEAGAFILSLQRVSEASKDATTGLATLSPAMIQHAALAGNAAEQELVLGVNIEHSTSQYVERANVITRLASAERSRLSSRVQELEAQRQTILNDVNTTSIAKLGLLRTNEAALTTARAALTGATDNLTGATERSNAATAEELAHRRDLLRLADAERDRLYEKSEAEKHAADAASRAAAAQQGRAEAIARAQARIASREGAAGLVATMEEDAVNRRIAAIDRLMGAQELSFGTAAQNSDREHERIQRETDARIAQASMADQLADKERNRLNDLQEAHESYAGRVQELQGETKNAQQQMAEFSVQAFADVGEALANNIAAWAAGKATIGEALQGMLSDILTSLGKQAMAKGAFEIAEGLAAIAGGVTAGAAPGHFAAAAAFFTVGAAATAGGAATAVTPSAPSTASAGKAAPAASVSSPSASSGSSGPASIINVYNYAPTFGGREGGVGEVGMHLDRYRNESPRLQRDRA